MISVDPTKAPVADLIVAKLTEHPIDFPAPRGSRVMLKRYERPYPPPTLADYISDQRETWPHLAKTNSELEDSHRQYLDHCKRLRGSMAVGETWSVSYTVNEGVRALRFAEHPERPWRDHKDICALLVRVDSRTGWFAVQRTYHVVLMTRGTVIVGADTPMTMMGERAGRSHTWAMDDLLVEDCPADGFSKLHLHAARPSGPTVTLDFVTG